MLSPYGDGRVCLNHINRLLDSITTRKMFVPINSFLSPVLQHILHVGHEQAPVHRKEAQRRETDPKKKKRDKDTKDLIPALPKTTSGTMLMALVRRIRSSRLRLH